MSDPKLTEADRQALRGPVEMHVELMIEDPAGRDIDVEADDLTDALAPVVARMVAAAEQTARAEERERIAGEIAGSYPLNGELRHDGSADPLAAAYVEGLHDAWAIVRSTP